MPSRKLPPELVSLIHHVELNKAGWWETAIQRLIVAAIWLSSRPLTRDEVAGALGEQFSVTTTSARLRLPIQHLLSNGTLVEIVGQGLRISQEALKRFEKELGESDDIERKAKLRFLSCMKERCPTLNGETLWNVFTEQLLLPLVHEVGARTYELVSGKSLALGDSVRLPEFLEQYPKDAREQLRAAIVAFLDPKDDDARSFVLRCLHSYFFVEAGNLSQEAVQSFISADKNPPSFSVFVDTNFLFSVLAFHDNPSNEAAESLMKVIAELPQKVTCKLYVFPLTVDETKHAIEFHRDSFKYIELTPNVASAAADTALSGISQKFVTACAQARRAISAEEYFGPYLTGLIPIIRSKGIEEYNQPVAKYSMDQGVIDDIRIQLDFQKRPTVKRPKTYEELRHDVVLWHFVSEKRPPLMESPLQAKYFVTTVDYSFLGFDAYKCRKENLNIRVCLHPSALMQLLQFWVPRSAALDEAVVGSLRWRFLFHDFDPKAESITLRILQTLSRFEDIADIPTETVKKVLLNEALRQKLFAEKDIEKRVELVRESLRAEGMVSIEKLQKAEAEAEKLKDHIQDQVNSISGLQQTIERYDKELTERGQDLANERDHRRGMEERLREIEENHRKRLDRQTILAFALKSLLALALLIGVPLVLNSSLVGGPRSRMMIDLMEGGLIMPWIWITDRRGQRVPAVNKWRPFISFHEGKNFLFSVLILGVVVHIVGAAVWDFLRTHIQLQRFTAK